MDLFTRRHFLAASALAVPAIRLARSANDVLRIAVIGVRGRGAELTAAFAPMKDVEIAALCDVDANVAGKAMKIAEEKGGKKPQFVQDIRKLLEDKSIDAVAVATTNHWHALATIWAVQAGKHVYVEKPVSHNIWEGRKMVEAARKYDRIVQAGTQRRSSGAIRQAIEFLQSGRLGKVKWALAHVYRRRESIGRKADAALPEGVDYNLWLGPAPERPFNPNRFHYEWHWNWDTGNGDLGNNGIHVIDVARWMMGKDGHPCRVMSVGCRVGYEDDGQTPNSQISVVDYGDSQIVCEVRGLKTEPYRGDIILHCEKGELIVGGPHTCAAFDDKGVKIATFAGAEGHHQRNFVDACKTGSRTGLAADIQEGHLSTAICHLGNISYRLGEMRPLDCKDDPFRASAPANEVFLRFRKHLADNGVNPRDTAYRVGRSLAFDPKTERFAEDAEATALLSRTYRLPFVVPETV